MLALSRVKCIETSLIHVQECSRSGSVPGSAHAGDPLPNVTYSMYVSCFLSSSEEDGGREGRLELLEWHLICASCLGRIPLFNMGMGEKFGMLAPLTLGSLSSCRCRSEQKHTPLYCRSKFTGRMRRLRSNGDEWWRASGFDVPLVTVRTEVYFKQNRNELTAYPTLLRLGALNNVALLPYLVLPIMRMKSTPPR